MELAPSAPRPPLTPARIVWLALKYFLAFLGGWAWLTIWFERSPWLGVAQLFIIVPGVWFELARRHASGRW